MITGSLNVEQSTRVFVQIYLTLLSIRSFLGVRVQDWNPTEKIGVRLETTDRSIEYPVISTMLSGKISMIQRMGDVIPILGPIENTAVFIGDTTSEEKTCILRDL